MPSGSRLATSCPRTFAYMHGQMTLVTVAKNISDGENIPDMQRSDKINPKSPREQESFAGS